jgi:hypothetical protein
MTRWHSITIVDRGKKLHTFDYVPRFEDQAANVEEPRLASHQRAITDGNVTHLKVRGFIQMATASIGYVFHLQDGIPGW